jgi:tRNA(Ile)-lysidine synthase
LTRGDLVEPIRAEGLIAPGRSVVVLLSGGRDSVCLLDVATRIAGADVVSALHVNYGLRPAAAGDEDHCRDLCGRLGVVLHCHRPHRPSTGNLQAWAREERYDAARALAGDQNAEIAVGHTATDQVETILYRLASSPSRRALLGMLPRQPGRPAIVRPLISYTREATAAHCRARGLEWREDESNDDDAYARNRIRHELVAALQSVHPAASANVLAVAGILREEAEVLDELVDGILGGREAIELVRLRELAPALRRLVVQRLADGAAGRPAAGVGRRAEEVAALPVNGRAALDLPTGVRATVDQGLLTMGRTPKGGRGRRPSPGTETTRAQAPTYTQPA